MTQTQINKLDSPTPADHDTILAPLDTYTEQQGFRWEKDPLTFTLTMDGKIKGGLIGDIHWGWFYIHILSVDADMRRQGHGRALMQAAERHAREHGCIGAWVNTFSFSAPQFYEGLGYREFGRISDYPKGHERLFFQKRFT